MRHVNVFCGRYSLATGTRVIAWFYIVLYLLNIILNIAAVDIVKSYKDNVDKDTDYDKNKLLTIHYICLTFGVVTILLSTAFLVKFSESEDFLHFMVKWNIIRCFFIFAGIIYISVEMHHVLTVSLSSLMISIDLCATTYFTGIMASYIKELEDPSGQVPSERQRSNGEPCVYLVSHKKSLHTENKVSYVNEVASSETEGFEEIPLNDKYTEANHNLTTTNSCIKTTQKENSASTNPDLNTKPAEGKNDTTESRENSATNCICREDQKEPGRIVASSDMERNSEMMNDQMNNESAQSDVNDTLEDSDVQTKSETYERGSDNKECNGPELSENSSNVKTLVENPTVLPEKSSDEKGIENLVVDVIETEPPSVVLIPASPEEQDGLGFKKDETGTVNPVFETVEVESTG